MDVRRPGPEDVDALLGFFERIPAAERTFFKESVLDRETVESVDRRRRRALACDGGEVAGYVAVVPLRRLVGSRRRDPSGRRPEVARAGASGARSRAGRCSRPSSCGLRKLYVEVVADQQGAVAMFLALGFQRRRAAADHVRDRDGELRDLVLLAHPIADQWAAMASAGIDDAVT